MHQKVPQSTHKIQNFLGGMPLDPLEMVGPRAHLVSRSQTLARRRLSIGDYKRRKEGLEHFIDLKKQRPPAVGGCKLIT